MFICPEMLTLMTVKILNIIEISLIWKYSIWEVKALCLHSLKVFVAFFLRRDLEATSKILEKLESGTPMDWFVEEYGLDSRAIEGLAAYQALRDLMDEATQSVECD